MKKINLLNNQNAITEIIGTMILLIIAVSVIGYVYVTVFSNLTVEEDINCVIQGKIERGDVVFTHLGGEST